LPKPKRKPRTAGRRYGAISKEIISAVALADETISLGNCRRDAPVKCAACGRTVKRKSRQQRYCSDRCRDYARRENNARTAIKNPVVGPDTRQPTNPLFLSNKNNSLQGAKSGSNIPLNILGGYRWLGNVAIDSETLRKIIRAEIGGTLL
jgi:hypothetical protein